MTYVSASRVTEPSGLRINKPIVPALTKEPKNQNEQRKMKIGNTNGSKVKDSITAKDTQFMKNIVYQEILTK